MLRIISLGAGVQSTTMAIMSSRGDLPKADYAIFADTGWESAAVYSHLDWLEGQLTFPLIRARRDGMDLGQTMIAVSAGEIMRQGTPMVPFFTRNPDGMTPKHCSKEFKTRVIGREVRRLLGLAPGQRGPREKVIEQWIGISCDERERMKESEQGFTQNRWPLIELDMRREDCLRYMRDRQYPKPPRSSCIFCPFRTDREWRELRDEAQNVGRRL